MDTSLLYPFKDMIPEATRRNRSISNTPPPQATALPSPVSAPPAGERWADVLFNFPAEYPDELSIDVSADSIRHLLCIRLSTVYEQIKS